MILGAHSSLEHAVDAARRGDRSAFEVVYRECAPRIHSLARRLLGAGHADDLTQEVFVRAWRGLGSFSRDARFTTWLERIARNAITDHRRRLAREPDEPVTAEPSITDEPDLDLEGHIARLPRAAREVFVLHDVEGWKHTEVADYLGISTGTSKSQLHRARMLLRRAIRPEATERHDD